MEALGQDHGLVLYRTEIVLRDDPLELSLDGLADRALVLLDGEPVGVVSRNDEEHALMLPADRGASVLEVLVENQGRINFGAFIGDRKGISGARLGRRRLHEWTSRPLPIDRPGLVPGLPIDAPDPGGPGPQLARASVESTSPQTDSSPCPTGTRDSSG